MKMEIGGIIAQMEHGIETNEFIQERIENEIVGISEILEVEE